MAETYIYSIDRTDQAGLHRTGSISGLTYDQIVDKIGFKPNIKDDGEKVVNSWGFVVTTDNQESGMKQYYCGVWDYKGSHMVKQWSTYGDQVALKLVFGEHYSE